MFSLETPSRVLRRIQILADQEDDLPSLPDFPSFDDDDDEADETQDHTNNNNSNTSKTPVPPTPALLNITNSSSNNPTPLASSSILPPSLKAKSTTSKPSPPLPSTPSSLGNQTTTSTTKNFTSPTTSSTHSTPAATPAPSTSTRFFSTPLPDRTDAERRKEHLLTTLRSTARPRLALGTPHPAIRRVSATLGVGGGGGSDEGDKSYSSDGGSSSNDLTTHHMKANTSLPSGGLDDTKNSRFNGAKLNSYLHNLNTNLTEENQSLAKELEGSSKEVRRLRKERVRLGDQVRELSVLGSVSGNGSQSVSGGESGNEDRGVVEELKRELGELKHHLDQVVEARDSKAEEVEALKQQLAREKQIQTREQEALNARADELLIELESRDNELERAKAETEEQSVEFADKMAKLEEELCRVMEEQEAQLEAARADLIKRREEDEEVRNELTEKLEKVEEVEDELRKVREERDRLLRRSQEEGFDIEKEQEEIVNRLKEQIDDLERTLDERDSQVSKLKDDLTNSTNKINELTSQEAGSQRQLSLQSTNLSQLEEALEESSRQLIQNEDELAELRSGLAREKTISSSLSSQIAQFSLHKTKSKSPLANEVSIGDNSMVASLEEELDQALKEIKTLQTKLEKHDSLTSLIESKDLEISLLKTHKQELEDRVNGLKQQHATTFIHTPRKTPDKSVMFKSIVGLKTPKTPGQFASNFSHAWSPASNSAGDVTISPLLDQIQELEQMVSQLQNQLSEANDEIDQKLDKLEQAGTGTISLSKQLSLARERSSQLEAELDRLVGDDGSLLRVSKRLKDLNCPGCGVTFDANKIAQLRWEPMSRSVDGLGSKPRVNASLREALAGVNSKVTERRGESTGEIEAEKENLIRQHTALQKNFDQARGEIADLETELRSERNKLRTLANEQSLANRAKVSLEKRLSMAETELRQIKQELAGASKAVDQDRLRKEKSDLVDTRADLLQQLAEVNQRASRFDSELASSKACQADMQAQLEQQIREISQLRNSLHTKEAEHRLLQDERGDILRGVAGLQSDLQRVRQDAISLGIDLANVRRERDAIDAKRAGDGTEAAKLKEELNEAKRKLEGLEQKTAEHVCTSNPTTDLEVRTRHSQEAKGLLVQIRHLKLRVTREATFRNDLSYQKTYLGLIVKQKQSSIDATLATLSQLGLPRPSSPRRPKLGFKGAARAVMAIARMKSFKTQWQEQSIPKMRLRTQAYPDTRGRPFIGAP